MIDPESRVRSLAVWKGTISAAPLKGGVSNASFAVSDATGKYVVRVGEDYPCHQVSRAREAIAARAAFAAGLSPEVVHTEAGIMVLRYLDARTYGEADVRDYAHALKAGNHRHVPDLPRWMAIVDELETAQVALPVIFGHHDLLPGNFMDDGKRLWLIDWEYGAFGTAMFDLANIAANNSFDDAGEKLILETYFGKTPDQSLLRAFYAMKAASALREAVWGMVSELHLNAPGVDYIAYAAEYLGRFERVYADYTANFGKS